MKINIALVQFRVELFKNQQKLFNRIEFFLRRASVNNCKIICFPEDFCFGPFDYYKNSEIDSNLKLTPRIINWLCTQAIKYNIAIIAGTFIKNNDGKLFNTSTIISCNGTIIAEYYKRKRVPYGFESKYIKSGKTDNPIVTLYGIRIGVTICRELFYPDIFKTLRKNGVDVIFVPSFWSKRSNDYDSHRLINSYRVLSEMRVVDTLCPARSIENECLVCFVNACGNLKQGKQYDVLLGRTQVSQPFYGTTQKINQNKEGLILFEYDSSLIEDARKAYQLI